MKMYLLSYCKNKVVNYNEVYSCDLRTAKRKLSEIINISVDEISCVLIE